MNEEHGDHATMLHQRYIEDRSGIDSVVGGNDLRGAGARIEQDVGNGDRLAGFHLADERRAEVVHAPAAGDGGDASVIPVAGDNNVGLVILDFGEAYLRGPEVLAKERGCCLHHRHRVSEGA